ncbi:HNH endonuclease [Parafrankia discariae]|uniref:HNH endonuclease n=1 Tax=Parafrankia discariae TaxID=365528 RepID=UPI00037BD7CD|nr:HNH endonuclease signature motif containing protein [Parafrankia discariae]
MARSRPPWLPVTVTAAPSARPTDEIPADTRRLVLARAGGRCESCAGDLDISRYSLHHRRPKGMGGSRATDLHSPTNLLVLCGRGADGCHGDVHGHPVAARDAGMLVRRAADPARVSVLIHGTRRVLLTAEGSYAEEAR